MASLLYVILLIIISAKPSYSQTCEPEQECVVNCTTISGDCEGATINATTASFLSVFCERESHYSICSNMVMNCPISGCNITCGYAGCDSTVINLPETHSLLLQTHLNIQLEAFWITINVPHVDTLDLNWRNSRCTGCKLHIDDANKVIINAESANLKDSTLNITSAKYVHLRSIGDQSFRHNSLFAQYAESVTITLSADRVGAARDSTFYVPSDTIWNCYGRGCGSIFRIYYDANISSQFTINLFTCGQCALNGVGSNSCVHAWSAAAGDAYVSPCAQLTDDCFAFKFVPNEGQCGCHNLTYIVPSKQNDADDLCYYVQYDDNPPYPDLVIDIESVCEEGEDCFISCVNANVSCYGTTIDATHVSYLTIICDDCEESTIICPDKGCNIVCSGDAYESCTQTYIIYNGAVEDEGDINITCTGNLVCYELTIQANEAYKVSLMCDGSGACSSASMYAYYANQVHVIANKPDSVAVLRIAAYYAHDVRVTGTMEKAFYAGSLFADYAKSVTIECSTALACYLSYFYLPANATVICKEAHCLFLNRYFVENGVQDLSFKNLSTGCNLNNYFEGSQFGCGYGYTSVVDYDDCDEECGCSELMESIKEKEGCLKKELLSLSGGAIAGIVIAVVAVIFIAFCIYYHRKEDVAQPDDNSDGVDNDSERVNILNND
eukprot:90982_1